MRRFRGWIGEHALLSAILAVLIAGAAWGFASPIYRSVTCRGGNLTVKDASGNTKFSVTYGSGNTAIVGTLGVTGTSTLTGAATCSSTLAVVGAATIPVVATATNTTDTVIATTVAGYYGKVVFLSNAGATTVTMPENSGATVVAAGTWVKFVRTGNEALAINTTTADTLIVNDNAAADGISFANTADIGSSVLFISNGANWVAINECDNAMTVVDA